MLLLRCRFNASEHVSGSSLAKSSVSRNIKKAIAETYPPLAGDAEVTHLDSILGDKKRPMHVVKWCELTPMRRAAALCAHVSAMHSLSCVCSPAIAALVPPVCWLLQSRSHSAGGDQQGGEILQSA